MYKKIFRTRNLNKPKLAKLDPATTQRIKEGSFLSKVISEAQVSARKCDFYANNCSDNEIAAFLKGEANVIRSSTKLLEDYYESITKES